MFCGASGGVEAGTVCGELKAFGTPFSMAVGDRDFVLKKSVVEEIEGGLRREFGNGDDGVRWEVEMDAYKECGHGFAVRADEKKEVEKEGADKACEQAVRWFKLFL